MFKKTQKILVFLFITYVLVGFFATPPIVKSQLKEIVEQELNAKLSIQNIYFNPFSFRLVVNEIELRDIEENHLFSFESLDINLDPSSLYKQAIHIKNLVLQKPKISLIYEKDKTINFASIVKTKEKNQKEELTNKSVMPRVILDNIAIVLGSLDYEDYIHEKHFKFSFQNIGFSLRDIDTDDLSASDAMIRLHTNLGDGGFLDIKSQLLSLKPFEIKGRVDFQASKLYSQWKYFKEHLNLEVADGRVNLKAKYYFNLDKLDAITISELELYVDKLRIKPKNKHQDVLNLEYFSLSGVTIKPLLEDIYIKNLALESLHLRAQRQKDGEFDWSEYIKTPFIRDSAGVDIQTKDINESKPWNAFVDEVRLKNIKLDFTDQKVEPSVTTTLDKINLNAYGIDSKENSWFKYDVSARLNGKGNISLNAEFRHTPLKQKSDLKLSEISLKEFSPYLQEVSYLELKDAHLNLDSKVEYEKSENEPDLRVYGGLNIEEFFLNDTRDDSTLLSFTKMQLNSFEYEMNPDRVYIGKIDLGGFYIKAIIDKQKVLNLATLLKESENKQEEKNNAKDVNKNNESKFDFKVVKLNIESGNARFEDLFLPLEFKTDIHNLNGAIYAISNRDGEISYVDVSGEVDKYGSTKLSGSVDSLNPKRYLDLDFNFRNLDLNALSGYSASFTGYKIKEGKLFLDLGYKIVDSKLLGKNSIIIKKIKLGERIKSKNITNLPLRSAIALLENSAGVIDIDMPIEGDVGAPDFKYGTLVYKTFASLIIKAVASPFKFLGSMIGLDGEELEYLEFEAGLSTLLPPDREKLDNLLKIMLNRPKISLKITPQYDEEVDAFMIKREKLILALMKKSGVKSKKEQLNSLNIDLLEDYYEDLNSELKATEIQNRLKKSYSGEVLDREYIMALIKQATNLQKITQEELEGLAIKRGESVREYLVDNKALPSDRLIIDKIKKAKRSQKNWVRLKMNIELER